MLNMNACRENATLKLLVCTAARGIGGGSDTYLKAVFPHLSTLGLRLALLFENDAAGTETIDTGVTLERTIRLTSTKRVDVLAAMQDWRPDVVYNNGMFDLDFEVELTRFPVVYFAHNYAGTCVSGSKCHSWPAPVPCSRTFGPGCLAYYFPSRCGGLNPLTMLKSYAANMRRLAMIRGCTRLQVASEAMRAEYLRHGFSAEQIVLNPLFPANGIPDPSPPSFKPMPGNVLLAGRLTQLKGGDYLIRALHLARRTNPALGHLQLAVAGDGPELARLRALTESLGVPMQYHGWVDSGKLEAVMRNADVLAMPSLWPEPFGLLGLEAGCFGLPSVGYNHGGIPDWLVEGKSGALAPSPPTVEGLAQAIVRVLSDPQKHHAMRVGAWEIAKQFSIETHLHRLNDVLRSAAASSSSVSNK